MNLFSQPLGINTIFVLFSLILYVLFGQVTVRKLRNDTKTQAALGLEFASGWDIINVAQALSLPRPFITRMEKSPLAGMYADSNLLRANTTVLDRILAIVFYWIFTLSSLSMISLVALHYLGVFA